MKSVTLTISTFLLLSLCCFHLNAQIVTEFANTSLGFTTRTSVIAPAPEAAQLADLDGDGDLDAVIANGNFNSGFSVMLNNGNGRYGTPSQYTTGFESWDIVVADFTGDNIPDVVVSNTGSNWTGSTISLFPGNGNGTFGTKTNYPVGNGPIGVAAADFNLDGFIDLAVANNGGFGMGSTVSILTNNTTGGFLAAVTIPGGTAPYKIAAGLMDADSLPDIIVANEAQKITLLHNTGSGFTNTTYLMQSTIISNIYTSIQLADVDNDSDLDVFYSSPGTQQISLRRNLGNGTLDSAQMIVMDFWYGGAPSFQVVDLSGDGFKDIVAAASVGATGDGYRIVLNQGNGTFGPEILNSAGQYTFVILAGDVDLDGDTDVLTVDNYSNELTVHPNNGSGEFPTPVLYGTGFPGISTKLEAVDIDNDGDLDIATSADSRTAINVSVAVSKNNGNGTFTNAINYSGFIGGVGVKLRDINNDGFADLVFASGINSAPYDFYTALNNGNGTFAALQQWSMNSCGWNDLDVADLDNDGDLDVIVTEWLGCSSVPFSGQRVFLSYNLGGGNFSAPTIKIVNPFPGPIAICDFNEDGFLDIATGQSTSIDISLNNGAGDLISPVSFQMSQSPYDILATDLNNDGHTDLASCNYGSNPGDYNLTVRMGNGNGTFQSVQLIDAAYSPDLANVSGVAAGDVDNDGDVDLIVSQNASNDMSIYLNNGSGVFSYDHRLCVYYGFRSPWFADFTGDGIKDLAGLVSLPPSGMPSALTILPGITTGTATGGSGLSACGTIPTVITDNTLASHFAIEVSPNPFNESTTVSFDLEKTDNVSISIIDIAGREIKNISTINLQTGKNKIKIDLSELNSGIYFCKIKLNVNIQTVKLIKN
ncbi:MAG TPA: T9SS type A sorting domain-containing protein [Bacteroidia bacterium]|nr:T9SS type A sorting domain-containing protein [Bacteroidia bacterium]